MPIPLNELLQQLESNDPSLTSLNLLDVHGKTIMKQHYSSNAEKPTPLIDDDVMEELAKGLRHNKTLKHFSIKYRNEVNEVIKWRKRGAEALGRALGEHPALESIHLGLNNCRLYDCHESGLLLALHNEHLKSVDLITQVIFCKDHERIVKRARLNADLEEYFADMRRAKEDLITVKNELEEDRQILGKIGRALANNTSLEEIKIRDEGYQRRNYLNDAELKTFIDGFTNKPLKTLTLDKIVINNQGYLALTKALTQFNTLELLHLVQTTSHADNAITKTTMQAFVAALVNHPNLYSLDLSDNYFTDDAIQALFDALPLMPKLRKLVLRDTNFKSEDFDYLVKMLSQRPLLLTELYLSDRSCIYQSFNLSSIQQLLATNTQLKTLWLKIDGTELITIANFLSDPKQCFINHIKVSIPDSEKIKCDANFAAILTANPNIKTVGYEIRGREQYANASKINHEKHTKAQQTFITNTIKFANAFTADSADEKPNPFHLFPEELLFYLMLSGSNAVFGMNAEDKFQCCCLILTNFRERREQINSGLYLPPKKASWAEIFNTAPDESKQAQSQVANIHSWWSRHTRDTYRRPLFKAEDAAPTMKMK